MGQKRNGQTQKGMMVRKRKVVLYSEQKHQNWELRFKPQCTQDAPLLKSKSGVKSRSQKKKRQAAKTTQRKWGGKNAAA